MTNMMLPGFYAIKNIEKDEEKTRVNITLNPDHEIYKGHFHDNPVVPGVCQIQIIKEVLEQLTESTLFMYKAADIKYLAVINPLESPDIILELCITATEEGTYQVNAVLVEAEKVFLKFKGSYRKD